VSFLAAASLLLRRARPISSDLPSRQVAGKLERVIGSSPIVCHRPASRGWVWGVFRLLPTDRGPVAVQVIYATACATRSGSSARRSYSPRSAIRARPDVAHGLMGRRAAYPRWSGSRERRPRLSARAGMPHAASRRDHPRAAYRGVARGAAIADRPSRHHPSRTYLSSSNVSSTPSISSYLGVALLLLCLFSRS